MLTDNPIADENEFRQIVGHDNDTDLSRGKLHDDLVDAQDYAEHDFRVPY